MRSSQYWWRLHDPNLGTTRKGTDSLINGPWPRHIHVNVPVESMNELNQSVGKKATVFAVVYLSYWLCVDDSDFHSGHIALPCGADVAIDRPPTRWEI